MQQLAGDHGRCPAFSPRLTRKVLKRHCQQAGQTVSFGASLYLSGVLSYLTAEILSSASESAAYGQEGTARSTKTILPSDVRTAVSCDEELFYVFPAWEPGSSFLSWPGVDGLSDRSRNGRSAQNQNQTLSGRVLEMIGALTRFFGDLFNSVIVAMDR